MTIFWHPTGPVVKYEDGMLGIWNLNPEVKTGWRMSRWEMIQFGWRCVVAGCRRSA